MKHYSCPRNALYLGSALLLLSAGWQLAAAEPAQSIAPAEPSTTTTQPVEDSMIPPAHKPSTAGEAESKPPLGELNRRTPAVAPNAATRPTKPVTAASTKSADLTEQLQSQIRLTQREREEAAQEHQLLKTRLAEMEKKIKELMQQNAERDAALKAQTRPVK